MNKFAKLEIPSDKEKRNISEPEQYIDQSVTDDIKNKNFFNKRRVKSMYRNNEYEGMVHEAYEAILDGFDKEAGAQAEAYKASKAQRYAAAARGSNRGVYDDATLRAGREEIAKYLAKKNNDGKLGNFTHTLSNPTATAMMLRGLSNKQKAALIGGTAGIAALGTAGTMLALKHKKNKSEEAAEKAAAYYDEAQLVKEAAANDYEVACAYEEAALNILGELGYFNEE